MGSSCTIGPGTDARAKRCSPCRSSDKKVKLWDDGRRLCKRLTTTMTKCGMWRSTRTASTSVQLVMTRRSRCTRSNRLWRHSAQLSHASFRHTFIRARARTPTPAHIATTPRLGAPTGKCYAQHWCSTRAPHCLSPPPNHPATPRRGFPSAVEQRPWPRLQPTRVSGANVRWHQLMLSPPRPPPLHLHRSPRRCWWAVATVTPPTTARSSRHDRGGPCVPASRLEARHLGWHPRWRPLAGTTAFRASRSCGSTRARARLAAATTHPRGRCSRHQALQLPPCHQTLVWHLAQHHCSALRLVSWRAGVA